MKTRIALFCCLLAVGSLAGCSSRGVKEQRVGEVTTTIDKEAGRGMTSEDELTNTLAAEIEGWDERINDLKSQALNTKNPDRFKLLNNNITDLEKQMREARVKFHDFQLAETDEARAKDKDKLADTLKDVRRTYNSLPAE